MPLQNHLEYEEQDLDLDIFESDSETEIPIETLNKAKPIPGSSKLPKQSLSAPKASGSASKVASSSKVTSEGYDSARRLSELLVMKKPIVEVGSGIGPRSLRDSTMRVLRTNSAAIYHIGYIEYPLIADLLMELPMNQLEEIERNSHHITKDTDWLWEYFLLQDFPLFHERCYFRKGSKRDSGWRRMYTKAQEDAEERKQQAQDRVAARYKQLEEEKAKKRIVFVDKIVATKKGGGRGFASAPMNGIITASGASGNKVSGAIAKARADAQRARVALTHASGKYIPPPASSSYRPKPTTSPVKIIPVSRLPPPRTNPPPPNKTSVGTSSSKRNDPFPGSFPTSKLAEQRAALPAHISSSPSSSSRPPQVEISSNRERPGFFDASKPSYKEIKKSNVPSFEAPKITKRPIVDIFGDTPPTRTSQPVVKKVRRNSVVDPTKEKEGQSTPIKDKDKDNNRSKEVSNAGKAVLPVSSLPEKHHPSAPPSIPAPIQKRPAPVQTEAERLGSVLFRKKPKPRHSGIKSTNG